MRALPLVRQHELPVDHGHVCVSKVAGVGGFRVGARLRQSGLQPSAVAPGPSFRPIASQQQVDRQIHRHWVLRDISW